MFINYTLCWIRSALGNCRGATAIEYGLIAAGISVAIAGTAFLVGTDLNTTFDFIKDKLETAG